MNLGEQEAFSWSIISFLLFLPTKSNAASSISVFAAGENLPFCFCSSGSLQESSSFFSTFGEAFGGLVLPVLDVTTTVTYRLKKNIELHNPKIDKEKRNDSSKSNS